jgi:tetratricopeptide (TPR) repeat protein
VTAAPGGLGRNAGLRIATVAAVMAAALVLSCFRITNLDIGGHIAVGREILKSHAIPDADFFTHTARGNAYPVHQWLGEVVVFAVEYLTGATGLVLLRMMIVLLGAVLLYRNARREGAAVVVSAGIVLLLLVCARPRFFVRPMLISFVFLPLLQTIVSRVRKGQTRQLWPMLPLLAVWGHVHSGVLFGVLLLLGTLVGEGAKILLHRPVVPGAGRWPGTRLDGWNYRRLVLFSLAAIALPFVTMALINPSGLKPLVLPLLFFRNTTFQAMISEYRTVNLAVDWPFDVVAGAVLLGVLLRPRRVDLTDLLVTAGFGVLAYQAVRGILPFAAVSAPLLARTWGALADDAFTALSRRGGGGDRPGRGASAADRAEAGVLVAVVAAAALVSVRAAGGWLFPFGFGQDPKHYPRTALDFLAAEGVRGHVFNTDVWASSLLWRWRGVRYPVFVDARLEAYPESFWRDEYYRVLQAAPGWQRVLDDHAVQWAMLRRRPGGSDDRIGDALWDDPAWGVVYWDDVVMILVRRGGPSRRNDEILDHWEFRSFSPRRPYEVRDLRGDALARAANELSGVVGWAPESFLPRWALAAAWTRLGKGEEAAELLARIAGKPEARDNRAFLDSRAEAELVAGRRDGWAKWLRRSGADPTDPDRLFEAGVLLSAAGRRDEAIALYRETLAAAPRHADAMNNLALLLSTDEDTRHEALELIDRAVRRAPDDGYILASRAEIRWRDGDRLRAHDDFRRALELIPEDAEAARAEIGAWLSRDD